MDTTTAASAFAALGLPRRLEIVLMLVATGDDGMMAGEIAERLAARQNSVSSQLKILTQAGLIVPERDGRRIIYRANRDTLRDLRQLLRSSGSRAEPPRDQAGA